MGKEDDLFSPYLDEPFELARREGIIPEGMRSIGGTWGRLTDAGEATTLNMIMMGGFDCTDVRDATRAESRAPPGAPGYRGAAPLRARLRGCPAAQPRHEHGTPDSAAGRYELTGDDVRGERVRRLGRHLPEFIDGYGILVLPTTGRYFQVPYGILVPRDVDNLLVAGRCTAGDKLSHAATRNQMCCAVTGQAAGVAAAVSLRDGRTSGGVDVARVQAELKTQGVRLA